MVERRSALTASCVRPQKTEWSSPPIPTKVKRSAPDARGIVAGRSPLPAPAKTSPAIASSKLSPASEPHRHSRFATDRFAAGTTILSLTIAVDHQACILCDRCIRGCNEIRHNYVLARQGKGYHAGIAFDDDKPMGNSSCVSCGECMVSCPTGALTNQARRPNFLQTQR